MKNNKKVSFLGALASGISLMITGLIGALLFALEKIGLLGLFILGSFGLLGARSTSLVLDKAKNQKQLEQNSNKEELGEVFYSPEVSDELKQRCDFLKTTIKTAFIKRKNLSSKERSTDKTL